MVAEKKIIDTPVSPLITTCVVDMGSANISTLTRMRAEHIYVEPRTMNPSRRLTILATGTVSYTVVYRVNLLMVSIPIASNKVASTTRVVNFAFLLTYAIPMMFESEIAPMQTPVKMAKMKLV